MSLDPNKKIKVIFACLDWRLHPQIENFFTSEGDGCDMCVTAGSVKALVDPQTQNFMLQQIEISKNLHNCQTVVLTMHIDCGAYGGSKAFHGNDDERSACLAELTKAKTIVRKKFFELRVETYLIGLDHTISGWNIGAEKVQA
jgi:hypothetical protein